MNAVTPNSQAVHLPGCARGRKRAPPPRVRRLRSLGRWFRQHARRHAGEAAARDCRRTCDAGQRRIASAGRSRRGRRAPSPLAVRPGDGTSTVNFPVGGSHCITPCSAAFASFFLHPIHTRLRGRSERRGQGPPFRRSRGHALGTRRPGTGVSLRTTAPPWRSRRSHNNSGFWARRTRLRERRQSAGLPRSPQATALTTGGGPPLERVASGSADGDVVGGVEGDRGEVDRGCLTVRDSA